MDMGVALWLDGIKLDGALVPPGMVLLAGPAEAGVLHDEIELDWSHVPPREVLLLPKREVYVCEFGDGRPELKVVLVPVIPCAARRAA